MDKEKKKKHFIAKPEYPGGPKEMTKFLYGQLRFPKAALEAGIEGTVVVEYGIDHQGNVVDTRILQGLGYGCDEEAARVVRLLKFEMGKYRGIKVLFHQKAHLQFRKPAAQQVQPAPATGTMQVNYVVTPTPTTTPAAEKPQQKTGNTYQYTIKLG